MSLSVTVVMSVYQPNLDYLAKQLRSIAEQDYDALRVMVRNDYPAGDNLEDFCREQCACRELTYVHGSHNLGYVKGFERLVQLAAPTCDVLALCDQDDLWLPNRISRCMPAFEDGALVVACDRSIIDADDNVVVPSWRAAHAKQPENAWHTGDRFVAPSIFASYAPGMAMMVRSDIARGLVPFSEGTGHDKWLMTGANIQGTCAFVDEPLVCYRRHGTNVSGSFAGIACKDDWYEKRVGANLRFAIDMKRRFPDCAELDDALAFIRARQSRNVGGILRHRKLAPSVAAFELALLACPDWAFKRFLRSRGAA